MIDYLKLWIEDVDEIEKVRALPFLSFTQMHDLETGELIRGTMQCKWHCFELKFLSDTRLQIAGSLHKFFHTNNAGDFTYSEICESIDSMCSSLQIHPCKALVKNIECGFNICPPLNASEIISEVLVYKNSRPNRPYEGNDEGFYFIEFAKGERYLKIYDKGKQYHIANTLRVELKLMRSREFNNAGVYSLENLMEKNTLRLLGKKTLQEFKDVVFDDSTIQERKLTAKEKLLYRNLTNPNKWIHRAIKNSTSHRHEQAFKELVNRCGQRRHSNTISALIENKLSELLDADKSKDFLSKYNRKPLQPTSKQNHAHRTNLCLVKRCLSRKRKLTLNIKVE